MVGLSEYRDLYYRWEKEQWSAGSIDLTADREQWGGLAVGLREEILTSLAPFHVRAEKITDVVVALLDSAPTEEQQVALSTQLVDRGRHAVFVERYVEEVTDVRPAELVVDPTVDADLTAIYAADGGSAFELHFGFVSEARTHLASLRERLVDDRVLPGLVEGLEAVLRDLARHLEFAELYLSQRAGSDASP